MPRGIPGSGKAKTKVAAASEASPRKRGGRPGPRRPIHERLEEARHKLESYRKESADKLRALEKKVATLEAQQASQPTKQQIKDLVEGKTADQLQMELLEAEKKLKLLKAATKTMA